MVYDCAIYAVLGKCWECGDYSCKVPAHYPVPAPLLNAAVARPWDRNKLYLFMWFLGCF